MHVAIVHYSELVPRDDGFSLTRYAATSEYLIAGGYRSTRLYPRFSHRSRARRNDPIRWSHQSYGDFYLIETPSYSSSRSIARLKFLKEFKHGVIRALHELKPDVVLVGMPPPGIATAVAREGPESINTIAIDVRDLWPDAQLRTMKGLQKLFMYAYAPIVRRRVRKDLGVANRLVAISEQYRVWACERTDTESSNGEASVVVPLGTPIEVDNKYDTDRTGVIFAGSLSEHFDFPLLLNGWKMLSSRRPDLVQRHQLSIIGGGAAEEYLQQRATELANVKMLGRQSYRFTLDSMVANAVGVAPYSKNAMMGLPNKLFEYLGCGLPVISTLDGEAHRVITEQQVGASLPHATPEAVSMALETLLMDYDMRQQMSMRGLRLVQSKYDRKQLGAQLGDFLIRSGTV